MVEGRLYCICSMLLMGHLDQYNDQYKQSIHFFKPLQSPCYGFCALFIAIRVWSQINGRQDSWDVRYLPIHAQTCNLQTTIEALTLIDSVGNEKGYSDATDEAWSLHHVKFKWSVYFFSSGIYSCKCSTWYHWNSSSSISALFLGLLRHSTLEGRIN